MEQLSILETESASEAPRCRMCARQARWLRVQQQYAMYCTGKACSNRERICQNCGGPFTIGVGGAGTKYCSTDCKADGYRPHKVRTTLVACAWCATEVDMTPIQRRSLNRTWPFVCSGCLSPINHVLQRLRSHHVPHERARKLLDDPGCDICGTDILTPVHDSRTSRSSAPLVVDHDHRCCPRGHYSCGNCVRGLLCHQCNTAAGMLRDDPARARALADYLTEADIQVIIS